MDDPAHIGFRLSAQRALLGNVPPALRSVSLSVDDRQREWRIRFVFTTDASDEELEFAWIIATEIGADFPDWTCNEEYCKCDPPTKADGLEWHVYSRWEGW